MTTRLASNVHPGRAFLVVGIGVFLAVLDLFIVNIALPALRVEYATSTLPELSWVLNAYAIVFAAILVPAGKLGDLYGRRRVFMVGLGLFLAGSATAAAAGSLPILIAARAIQAIGGASMTPNSLGVILPLFPPHRRATVIGGWAAIGGIGAAVGPVLGGLLAEVSWRWIFLVNLPIGLVALVLIPRVVPEIRQERVRTFPDIGGSVLLMGAIGLLTFGLSQGSEWAWDGRVLGSLGVSAVLVASFVRRTIRHPAPVVELPMLAVPAFALASLATIAFYAGFAVSLVSNVLFLTGVWRYPFLWAGVALAVGPAAAAASAALAGWFMRRSGAWMVGASGAILFGASMVWYIARLGTEPTLFDFLVGQLAGGAGIGFALAALTTIGVSGLPSERLATGIAVLTMFRQLGAALGVAVWVATLAGGAALRSVAGFHPGWAVVAGMSATSAALLIATAHPVRAQISAGRI